MHIYPNQSADLPYLTVVSPVALEEVLLACGMRVEEVEGVEGTGAGVGARKVFLRTHEWSAEQRAAGLEGLRRLGMQ